MVRKPRSHVRILHFERGLFEVALETGSVKDRIAS